MYTVKPVDLQRVLGLRDLARNHGSRRAPLVSVFALRVSESTRVFPVWPGALVMTVPTGVPAVGKLDDRSCCILNLLQVSWVGPRGHASRGHVVVCCLRLQPQVSRSSTSWEYASSVSAFLSHTGMSMCALETSFFVSTSTRSATNLDAPTKFTHPKL